MITKKLGKVTFGWDPNAMKGKGYWYVLGKDESFSRAASATEAMKLGVPKQMDAPKKGASDRKYFGFKTYFDVTKEGRPTRKIMRTGSDYETADIIRSKGLMQLATEKLLSGESLGGSIKGAFKDKKDSILKTTSKVKDPMYWLSKLPGVGQLAAAQYGKMKGRTAEDISYFTGVRTAGIDEEEMDNEPLSTTTKEKQIAEKIKEVKENQQKAEKLKTGRMVYRDEKGRFVSQPKQEETSEEVVMEEKAEEKDKHDELIEAIKQTYRWGDKYDGKNEKKKSDRGFFEGALDFLSSGLFSKLSKLLTSRKLITKILIPILTNPIVLSAIALGLTKIAFNAQDNIYKNFDTSKVPPPKKPEEIPGKIKSGKDIIDLPESEFEIEVEKRAQKKAGVLARSGMKVKDNKGNYTREYLKTLDFYRKEARKELEAEVVIENKNKLENSVTQKNVTKTTSPQSPSETLEGVSTSTTISKAVTAATPKASKVTTTPIEGTLSGVTSSDIQNHPKFQQYYNDALQVNPSDKQAAYEEAAMKIKSEMIQPVPSPSVLGQRAASATISNNELKAQQTVSGSLPVVVNNTNNNVVNNSGGMGGMSASTRNQDPVLTRVQYQNVKPV